MRLVGKVAVITGAGSGIGRATALLFAKEGARVVVADLNSQTGGETARQIKGADDEATFVQVDVSKAADAERMIMTAIDTYGKLDILFNNAGVTYVASPADMPEEKWDRVLDVNLKGMFLGCKYAIPEMKKVGGGAIINTSSVAGLLSSRSSVAYSASKGGVVLLTKSLALALAKDNIRVNCVCPGPIETPMMWLIVPPTLTPEEGRRWYAAPSPMGRVGKPEEIATVVLFLASDAAFYITGAALPVDGGWVAH